MMNITIGVDIHRRTLQFCDFRYLIYNIIIKVGTLDFSLIISLTLDREICTRNAYGNCKENFVFIFGKWRNRSNCLTFSGETRIETVVSLIALLFMLPRHEILKRGRHRW